MLQQSPIHSVKLNDNSKLSNPRGVVLKVISLGLALGASSGLPSSNILVESAIAIASAGSLLFPQSLLESLLLLLLHPGEVIESLPLKLGPLLLALRRLAKGMRLL